jgi:probable F420-dependent oxidoreductase
LTAAVIDDRGIEEVSMKIGITIPNTELHAPQTCRTFPQFAEQLGFDSLWLTDHVVGARAFSTVNYGPVWMEALSAMSYAAAVTSKARLGTSVLVLPLRDPVYTAKVLATIDHLSNGRIVIAVGPGWSKGEFTALGRGALHEPRGKVSTDALELILRCWEGGEFSWDSEFFNFRNMEFAPVPLQKPRPPIWIGGLLAAPVKERVKRFADVWHPFNLTPEQLPAASQEMNDYAGRDVPVSIRLTVDPHTGVEELAQLLGGYKAAGSIETVVEFRAPEAAVVLRAAENLMRAYRQIA